MKQYVTSVLYYSSLAKVMLDISSLCKAEEGGVAVATSTDDNTADGDIDSMNWLIMNGTVH